MYQITDELICARDSYPLIQNLIFCNHSNIIYHIIAIKMNLQATQAAPYCNSIGGRRINIKTNKIDWPQNYWIKASLI